MKKKWLNSLLLISSLLGYMEWGSGQQVFLFQAEKDFFTQLFANPLDNLHPFILLPLLGQVLLLLTLFQKTPGKWQTYTGIFCLGLLLVFLFAIGLLTGNWKMTVSALPFIIVSILAVVEYRR